MDAGEANQKPIAPRRRRWLWGVASLLAFAVLWVALSRTVFRSPAIVIHQNKAVPAVTNAFTGVLRIGAYNIAHGRGPSPGFAANFRGGRAERQARLDGMAALLRSNRLDLVVLNEVDFSAWGSHGVNQARAIAEAAGFGWWLEQSHYDANYLGINFHAGNAILSRYPLKEPELIIYPNHRPLQNAVIGTKRGAVCTAMMPDGTEVRLAAVHLDHENPSARVASAKVLSELAQDARLPFVFAGDFNSEPGKGGPTALDQFLDTHRHRRADSLAHDLSWPSASPTRALDWVLVPRAWSLVAKTESSATFSDHRLVIVETVSPRQQFSDAP